MSLKRPVTPIVAVVAIVAVLIVVGIVLFFGLRRPPAPTEVISQPPAPEGRPATTEVISQPPTQ